MAKQIVEVEMDVPDGWRVIGYRPAEEGESVLVGGQIDSGPTHCEFPIIERIFKVGDRVRCVDAECSASELHKGQIYTVTDVIKNYAGDLVLWLEGVPGFWSPSRFEPAPKPTWHRATEVDVGNKVYGVFIGSAEAAIEDLLAANPEGIDNLAYTLKQVLAPDTYLLHNGTEYRLVKDCFVFK